MSLASEKTTYEHVALDHMGVPYILYISAKISGKGMFADIDQKELDRQKYIDI